MTCGVVTPEYNSNLTCLIFMLRNLHVSQFAPASIMSSPLIHEKVWFEKNKYDEAERLYYENLVKVRQIWQVRRFIHAMKQLIDLK